MAVKKGNSEGPGRHQRGPQEGPRRGRQQGNRSQVAQVEGSKKAGTPKGTPAASPRETRTERATRIEVYGWRPDPPRREVDLFLVEHLVFRGARPAHRPVRRVPRILQAGSSTSCRRYRQDIRGDPPLDRVRRSFSDCSPASAASRGSRSSTGLPRSTSRSSAASPCSCRSSTSTTRWGRSCTFPTSPPRSSP